MLVDHVQIITSGDLSLATVLSIGIDLNQLSIGSIQAVWTGSPVGTLILQVSNDIVPVSTGSNPAVNVVNWSDYTNSSQAVSVAGDFAWNLNQLGFRWVRLKYTKTSGTGTINATLCGKG